MFLRKKLGAENGAVFCYVNSVFAPGLDEGVGNLWRVSGVDFFFLVVLMVGEGKGRGRSGRLER